MKIGAFIIHLARAEGRRAHVEALRAALPMPAEIVDAVDGALLSEAEKAAVYHPKLHRPRYPFALSSSEIGCFLSHRKAWRALLDSDLDAALVLEDDAGLAMRTLATGLDLARAAMGSGVLVRFPNRLHGDRGPVIASRSESVLLAPGRVGLGMVAFMLDRRAAELLLDLTARFDRPVDTFLQMRWRHGVAIRAVRPSGVTEVSDRLGGTTVQRRRPGGGSKLGRNMKRAVYRMQVALHSAMRVNPPR